MRRKARLSAELLEGRTLLSSLSYSLTTDQPVYQVGQPIEITFTETNTGKQPVTVEVSPTDFEVSQNGDSVWQSNPGNASQPPTTQTLKPGQSVEQVATWDGTTTYSLGGVDGGESWQINNFGTLSVSNPNGPQGLSASFQITDPITTSLTTSQPVYQLGEPVQVTFTEMNTASMPITMYSSPPEAANIYQNGAPLWVLFYPQVITLNPTVLSAGQTITTPYTFNIIPGSGPYDLNNLTGTFEAGFGPENDPTLYSASFQVNAPSPDDVATSLTTDQSTYALGQPVNMTLTETNNGDQPIVVLAGASSFQISENGTAIWNSPTASPYMAPTWKTLGPGQSYSQTDTWNGLPNTGALSNLSGVFTVSNLLDLQDDTATFQFTSPSSSQLATSLTTDKPVYQLGQPIGLTFTETNVGATPIQVLVGPASFDITQNGAQVWSISFSSSPVFSEDSWATLEPGQSVTQTAEWSGVPENLPSAFSNGTFTLTNALDPRAESTTFQIVAPPAADLSTSVTTSKSKYDYGEPIPMTLTETNVGPQPIVVLTGPTAFEATHDGVAIMDNAAASGLPGISWQTLEPGQSYSQEFTWSGTAYYTMTSPQATGTYSASNLLDPNGSTASFQIIPTVYVPPIMPAPPPPSPGPVTATLLTNHPAYKPGQSIHLSMVLENVSKAKVRLAPDAQSDGITVLAGSTVVFQSSRIRGVLAARTIKPHHSIKLALAWSGRPNQAGVAKLAPGTYTVLVVEGGYTGTTTVRLER
jgi:hypothetical protein